MASTPPNRSHNIPWWGRISLIWLLLVPLIVTIYTLLLPIAPNDFWYNARAGAWIAAKGTIPTTALFTTSVSPETPYHYQSWLAQLFLYKTLESYGLSGIVILRTACFLAAFILIAFTTWRRLAHMNRSASHPLADTSMARITALSTLIAFMLSASNMDIRPQTFSVPLFALFVLGIFEWPFLSNRQKTLVIGLYALAMTVWANTHGAFFIGIVLLGVYAGGEALQSLLIRRQGNTHPDRTLSTSLRLTCALWAVTCLAALLNPRGVQLFSYVFDLASLEAGQKYIQEWKAPQWSEWYGAVFFLTLIALCGATFIYFRLVRRCQIQQPGLRLPELLIPAMLATMALRDIRSIIWFGLFLAPVLAAQIGHILLARKHTPPVSPMISRPAQIVNAIMALCLLAGVLPFLPFWRTALPLPSEYFKNFAGTPRQAFPRGFADDPPFLLERNTPVQAVEYLRLHPPAAKIWNDFTFGSYLTWATLYEPRLAPYADPRVEMRPLGFWDEYGRIAQGPLDAADYLVKQGFSDALLDRNEQPELIARLKAAGWREIPTAHLNTGETAVLLRPTSK